MTYPKDSETVSSMSHTINNTHWKRVTSMLSSTKGKIFIGGGTQEATLHVDLTVVTDILLSDKLLESEIFGPILPVLTYKTLTDANQIIAKIGSTPLALYMFTEDKSEVEQAIQSTVSGGVAINDVMAQTAVTSVPLSGFGQSGTGSYRGRASIDTFSHSRSVVSVPTSEAFEGMLEWRYTTGDVEEKFKFFKANLEAPMPQ